MIPSVLTNMNLHINGNSYAGNVTEVSPPKLAVKVEEHRAGGMEAPIDMDLGLEKMDAEFTLSGWDADAQSYFGLASGNSFSGVFRGAFRDTLGVVKGVMLTMRGILKEIDPGSWKPGEKSETKYSVNLSYYQAQVDGVVVHQIEPIACVRIVNGVDQAAAVRAALGI